MGQFSWITQDTHEPIRNDVEAGDKRAKAFMHDNKGNVWEEENYEGYGEFGGKDFYELLAEMNGLEAEEGEDLRDKGITLAYSGKAYLSPNLTRGQYWNWRNEAPEDDPDQGWGIDENEWEDDDDDWIWSGDEDEEDEDY